MTWDDNDFNSSDPFVRYNAHQAAKGRTGIDVDRKLFEGFADDGDVIEDPAVRQRLYLKLARVGRTHRMIGFRHACVRKAWDARREARDA